MLMMLLWVVISVACRANSILIPMDDTQRNHLKAYGVAFYVLQQERTLDWLLNYRGGSFLLDYTADIEQECLIRGVSFEVVSDAAAQKILDEISSPSRNMNAVKLEKAPRIAVYSPKNDLIPDDTDAVILVLDYAEIPYEIIYDLEVMGGELARFDWLHLHHEDFTGQEARYAQRTSSRIEAEIQKITAQRLGYGSVSEMKLAVARKIKAFCAAGGYLFAMCSGAETFDIALAAEGMSFDDGDVDTYPDGMQQKLDFSKTLAFEKFTLEPGYSRRFSDINVSDDYFDDADDYFTLFQFSAKWDIIPTMLTQDHEHYIHEFHGLTTAFNKYVVKPTALILAENKQKNQVRYLYGELERGHWTYYSGHDPEAVPGRGRGPTQLELFPNSPGYRLILNNVLFPSAQKKKQKT